MARFKVKITLIFIIICCILLVAGCATTDWRSSTTSVSGRVTNDIGQPVVNASVTLWLDGKIVNISNNPQLTKTGWNGDEYQPYTTGSFEFDIRPDREYKITCEKEGYFGNASWDPGNPIPARVMIHNPDMNASDIKQKYGNVSDSQVEDAKALALNNQSIRHLLDGINYSIEYITTASDETDPRVMQISFLIGDYSVEGVEITSHLLICVDISNKRIVTIQHSYDASATSNYRRREIPPGSYIYSRIVVDDVNGSRQEHMLTLSFTGLSDLTVKPMVLDATNFKKFTYGEPYDIYLFGNQTVTSDWSKSLNITSNREYYFMMTNERTDNAAKIHSEIKLTV